MLNSNRNNNCNSNCSTSINYSSKIYRGSRFIGSNSYNFNWHRVHKNYRRRRHHHLGITL